MSKRNGNAGLKALAAILSVLFILLAVAGVVAYFSDWFTNWDKFKIEREEPTEETADGGMLIGESEGAGVSLLSEKIAKADYAANGVSPLAESAYTLTATVEPSNAVNKAVDWSVAFVNPSSSWATGKTVTDYVTVTPTSDGALTATVQNLKAFGEQIKVTVVSRANLHASAECIIDFARRIEDIAIWSNTLDEYLLDFGSNEILIDLTIPSYQDFNSAIDDGTLWSGGYTYFNVPIFDDEDLKDPEQLFADESANQTYKYSDYTIKDNLPMSTEAGGEYCIHVENETELNSDFQSIYISLASEISGLPIAFDQIFLDGFYIGNNPLAIFFEYGDVKGPFTETTYYKYIGMFVEWLQENPDTPIMTITRTITGKYSTFVKTYTFRYNPDSVTMPVFNISLDDSSLVF